MTPAPRLGALIGDFPCGTIKLDAFGTDTLRRHSVCHEGLRKCQLTGFAKWQRRGMSNNFDAHIENRTGGADGRRRQLRALLLAAANAARQGRQVQQFASCVRPIGQAVRDRVATLLSAAS